MKQLIIIIALAISSTSAFAQFPLGSDVSKIKAYFAENVSYASAQEFKTEDGTKGVVFTKVKVVGDYTFYFDYAGICTSYIVTYDKAEMANLTQRFDSQFCRTQSAEWTSEDNTFNATIVPPGKGENFFSIVYKPVQTLNTLQNGNTLAAN
jgi:hypothetical protein